MVLLDTDVMVDLLRGYPPAVAWLENLSDEEIRLPGFVVMELIQGCRDLIEQQRLVRSLTPYPVIWPLPETCDAALGVFTQYHLSHGLGLLDALIGQTAISLNLPICTFNQKHYSAFPGVRTLQPYER